jgi:peroxiredoxin
MTYDEAKKCARFSRPTRTKSTHHRFHCLSFGEETGVADALKWSGLTARSVQACDDDYDKLQLENRRDAVLR